MKQKYEEEQRRREEELMEKLRKQMKEEELEKEAEESKLPVRRRNSIEGRRPNYKATDGSLQSEDWGLNIEICDIINETEEGPNDAIKALKKRIVGNKNFNEVMLSLTLLEACVKNCGHRLHVLVSSREFVEGVLVKTILPKNNPPAAAWADAFRSSPDLTGVVSVYEDLRRKGLEFPMTDLDSLSPIHTPHRSVPDSDPAVRLQGSVRGLTAPPAVPSGTAWALPPPIAEQRAAPPPDSNPDGPITLSAEQVSDSTPDTSPASPAVIQSAAGSTVSGPPVGQSAVSSLSSQLASLNTGSSPASVSSTLQTLSTAPSVPSASKPVEEDEFDMFAQTRSSSLADQRKDLSSRRPTHAGDRGGCGYTLWVYWSLLRPFLPFLLISGMVVLLCYTLYSIIHSGPFTDPLFFHKFDRRWPKPLGLLQSQNQNQNRAS
ncbi:UNVERIFIED_CONTAM: hypothetical protein FKN15_015895 [Acipenser sinensis]